MASPKNLQRRREAVFLARAAAPALARVREDHRRAPAELQPLLAYLECHLFDSCLAAKTLRHACGVRGRGLFSRFRRFLGESPVRYLRRRRMEVGAFLLRGSDLPIWRVAELVGYAEPRSFTRAYRTWRGLLPAEERRRSRPVAVREVAERLELDTVETWAHTLWGTVRSEVAEQLVERLDAIYDRSQEISVTNPEPESIDGSLLEQGQAELLWASLAGAPWKEVRRSVLSGFRSPTLFELLRAKSREDGRDDRQRGVRIAKLAVDYAESCAKAEGGGLEAMEALAWASLLLARRKALDFQGAEEALSRARALLESMDKSTRQYVGPEIDHHEASLRLYQHRYPEARTLAEQAITGLRRIGNQQLLCRALMLRGSIFAYLGNPAKAIMDLQEVKELLEPRGETYELLTACGNLAGLHALSGDGCAALDILPTAHALCVAVGDLASRHHLEWIEGLARRNKGDLSLAEACFRAAYNGFQALGKTDHVAVVALDLALLVAEREGASAEVAALAADALPAFEALRFHREALAGLSLLRPALAESRLSIELLRKVRGHLELLRRDPVLSFFIGQ